MVDRLSPKIVSLSLVIVSVIVSALCAIFIVLAPQSSIKFFGSIFHGIDITKISVPITLSGVITGFFAIAIVAFVIGWLFAITYNLLANKMR